MNTRIKWLLNQLSAMRLEGMIVSNPVNVRYLTGLSEEGILLIAQKDVIFITDSRYIESVNKKLTIDDEIVAYDKKNLTKYDYETFFSENANVGFEENFITYQTYKYYLQLFKVNLIETDDVIENQRIVKDEQEISNIKKACDITDKSFEYITKNLKEGITEKEVAFNIERFMLLNGADGLAFDSIIAFGENSSMPHAVPTDRKLKKGDIIQFDIGCKYKGYCSDFSRVLFMNEVKDEYKKVYDFVLEEQKKISTLFKDGANIKSIIKDRETDYNLKNYEIMHAFGHGVGLDIHEKPFLRTNVDCLLKENSVVAIEPAVYEQGKFGIRIEDTFLVGKFFSENMTKSTKEIIVVDI